MAALIALALTPVWFTLCQLLATLAYVAHRDARERAEALAAQAAPVHVPAPEPDAAPAFGWGAEAA